MLEGLVANLLNRFLGMYVKNFDAGQLNVGIWSGDVKLRNLELRREALDQLHLPLNVVEGHLGELTLSIPWSNLRGKPVKIEIEDVFLLAAPKEDSSYDPEEEKRREHEIKMEKLESAELLRDQHSESMSKEEQMKNQSFMQSLVTAIIDNIQVVIKNVHFRYEDSIAVPGHPFALGLTLKELSAVSTDSEWRPTFIQSTSETSHKLAVLGALAVYWNTDAELFSSGRSGGGESHTVSHEELVEKFRQAIDSRDNGQYILKPVSGKAGLELDKTLSTDRPRAKARLIFDELGFVLDDYQYRDALMLVDLFHYFIRHREYKRLQPKCRPTEDPRAWFRFAGNAVLTKIHERNRRWTWEYIKERRDDRIRYIELFKKQKRNIALSTEEEADLKRLEGKSTYEDLKFWRSLGRHQLRKENIIAPKQPKPQSWSEWIWGSKKEETEDENAMTEEQRKELYDAIDWDEKRAISQSIDVPRESVKLLIESSLRAGSFTLNRNRNGKTDEVLKLVFDNFKAKALQRHDSFLAQINLGGLRLFDSTTEGTLFPQIIGVKDAAARGEADSPDLESLGSEAEAEEIEDSLFYLQFETNPLDGSADSALTMKLKSIEVIYNPRVLVEVVNFFRPPERHMESIGALLETAGATVEEIRQQTRAGLEFALEEHKTINAQLDIQAPVIIIPESITAESSTCLILDAGNVCVRSELVDKETIKMVQGKHGADYSDQDYEQLQNLMYDRFLLKLHSTQVLIGPGIEATKSQLVPGAESRNFHIMDRINIDFVLELCIVPKSTDLTRTRLSGRLPELHASMSDTKYKHLMKLIDIAIPHFDDDSEADSSDEKIKTISEVPDTRVRSSSVQLTSKEVPIVEQDSESDVDDTGDKTVQKPAKRPVNNHQRMFEFKFTVDRLRGSLYRTDLRDETKDTLLVELVAEHFQLDYYLRPYDMVAEIVLKSLVVDDHIEQDAPPEFKQIISSKGFNATEGKDLFQLKFIRVNPQSPEFLKVYEGTEMNLDLSISTINLIVTRKTLLTLLDFILITFTNPEQRNQAPISDQKAIERSEGGARVEPGPGRIRINSRLESIALIFNEDGVRLATLSLNTADVGIFVAGESLTVKGRMGSLTMFDDIGETTTRLLSIEGDDFADFRYQTFDPNQADYPGYSSEVVLRSGSIKINFIEEPYRRIINFLVKFGKMQAIFNAARQAAANQASQIQETASLMRFDIVVMTPILVFPRITENDRPRDFVTAHLGEIYANNKFEKLTEGDASANLNCVSAGIRHIRLTSNFYYSDEHSEELEMIEKVDLDFNIQYLVHQANISRPDIKVEGLMSPINLRISQMQLKLLTELSRTIPAALTPDQDQQEQEAAEALPGLTGGEAQSDEPLSESKESQSVSNLAPEIRPEPDTWVQLDFAFKVDTLGLELILAKENEPVGSLDDASLSKFFLSNTNVKLQMLSDGSLETELLIHSFNVRDSRKNETNRYRKIMSLINTDVQQQFMASLSMTGGAERKIIAMLTIDSPRVIFALDYLFALQSFVSAAFPPESEPVDELSEYSDEESQDVLSSDDVAVSGEDVLSNTTEVKAEDTPIPIAFRVNIVDAQAILVANPTISNSEAIVLGTKQVLYSQQNASTLQISKIGMFLCRMDKFETSRLRILDDFTLELSMDIRSKGRGCTMTRIDVHVDPLILRLSPRDIVLALQIMNKVSEMNTSPSTTDTKDKKPTSKDASHARRRSRGQSFSAGQVALCPNTAPKPAVQQSAIMKKEEMSVQIDGVRVILIGDLHMLPLVDWRVKQFNVDVRDWSGNMSADTTMDTLINVYNFSKSAWEPLIEPWQLGFHMSKEIAPDVLSVEAYSHKTMELTVTSATIALVNKTLQSVSTTEDVLSKPRGADAPYRIRNHTGFDLQVWADLGNGEEGPAALLSDGEERPWRFEDPTTMRESLAPEGSVGMVGVKLEGSGFDSINRIPLIREGETLYNLKPKQDRVLHRLLVEISLGSDYVKYITFRSPLLVENKTQIPLEVGVFSPEEGHLLKVEKILPGDSRPAPIGAAYMRSLLVRPDQGFGYDWSTESLFWRDLLKLPTKSLKCNSESGQQAPPFYFRMHATFDKNDPIHNVYPYMRIRLSAPLEIQNLLPYDFKYRIYDRNTRKDWTNFLRKGGTSPVHVVELSHLLLLSIDMEDTEFRQCEFAIINGTPQDDFRKEHTLSIQDDKGVELKLGLHYFAIPDSGGSFKVSVYSPYLILNRTGLDINIQGKSMFQSTRTSAGRAIRTDSSSGVRKAVPYMYSYATNDRKNRSIIKVEGSSWSKPQSLEAIGSTFEVLFPSASGKTEYHAGVSVEEGTGKYKITKVVTIAPRFILNNKLGEDLVAREPGSSNVLRLKSGDLVPLHFLRQNAEKQLCLCFPGVNNQWASPFNISDLGTVYVKLAKASQRQRLLRIEILMEAATIFLHISMETRHWPFSMRNESDCEFLFYQANPNVAEDEEDRSSGWRPIRYRLPPRSIMPYAWDYPASKNKTLVLVCRGKERYIKLTEIGNLIPMRVPPSQEDVQPKIIDLRIEAEGPAQILVLSNYRPSRSIYRQQKPTASQSSISTGFEVKHVNTDVTFKAQLRLSGIGISLINKKLKELVYVTFRDIEVNFSESKLYQTVGTTIKWIQIDNQLYGGIFPILLYPSVVPKTGREMEAHPIFNARITRVKDDSYGVLYIKYASVLLQQMTLELDEDFIFAMLDFVKVQDTLLMDDHQTQFGEELGFPEPKGEDQGTGVYFELLHIQPMQLDLSFVRTERVNVEDTVESSNPLMFFVNVMTMSIGNVNDAPVRLNALILENARISLPTLVTNITNHYTQDFLRQVHIVLGSADFLGNPVGLFNTVSSGVADIFYEPYQGLVADRPNELGLGIAKGATSFVKKSVFGLSDSLTKFTGSVSKGLAAATLDKEFQDQRRMSKARNRPKHALYGITAGGSAFASSMASGIGGLARHPLEGAEKEGFPGFMKGVAKGVWGLATKPAIGAFDLASNLAEGVRNTTTVFDPEGLDRVRLTRFIAMDGIVRPYSQREALGQFWLKTTDDGKYFNEDYIAHLEFTGKDMLVLLTYNRIMLVRSKKLATEWDIKLTDIQKISKERTGMSITLKGGANGPFIPVQEESSRNWLYKQIAIAVNAFNEKYLAKG
ncbi:vacuolar protein sorting-associated protein, putative [Coccidioides posadasii C735 delta SOWgp]|uniref:Vacuolar protein sorting-associated protein n=1 Tax=Coccidioides posadasii (strain C735) TaxID=222929 RepID=C5PG61_COCP7|nr:vacuolar protein sorting-associated protein, putative [Coccidioides posadasii C735 delta SOWgp]EER23514.1 vacuolar protein sorting-associated protein, putative [Coccidioides posadasii C735 delta SOWgp]|eukprot:XP_003065659.1 vacuolar protein sorting-associated protein, putative [Coccidioides posadasii C735 delta SOWgp]